MITKSMQCRTIFALFTLSRATFAHAEIPCSVALNSQLVRSPQTGLIAARVNGAPVQLLLDTGAFTTILSQNVARRLHLHADQDRSESFRGVTRDHLYMEGIGGALSGDVVLAESFQLGNLVGHHFSVVSSDLGLVAADGVLSTDFLKDYDIDIDSPDGQFRLWRASGNCERPKVYLQPPLYVVPLLSREDDPRPRVNVEINGHPFRALLDTGANVTTLSPGAARAIGISPEPASTLDKPIELRGAGPSKAPAVSRIVDSFTLGDLTIRHMKILVMQKADADDNEVLLGTDLQRKFHFWISNSSRNLVIQYPPTASPPVGSN